MKVKNYSYLTAIWKVFPVLMMLLVVNLGWAQIQTYTHTIGATTWTNGQSSSSAVLSSITWNLASTGGNFAGYDATKGHQFGSGGTAMTMGALSTTGISGVVSIVKLSSSTAASGTAKIASVKVGGVSFTPINQALTTANTVYTFTGSGSGEIIITWTNTSKAFYLKKIEVTYEQTSTPTLNASAATITGLDYVFGNGPSAVQNFTIDGINLDGSEDVVIGFDNIASSFEMSKDGITYNSILSLLAYNGSENTIYVRLKAGKTAANYTDAIKIVSNYPDTDITIPISGVVTAPPPVPVVEEADLAGTVGMPFTYQIVASGTPTSYAVSTDLLPAGLTLNTTTGLISGTPTAAGEFLNGIEATNTSGTSAEAVFIFEIVKGTQTLASFVDVTKYDTDTPFISTENTNAGLAVVYASTNSNVATVSGNTITITGVGTTTITATNNGNSNWNPFSQSITLTVTQAPEPYDGVGVFKLVTAIEDVTDGYYVITNETSEFLMTNGRSGTVTGGYFVSEAIIPVANSITNPVATKVWRIETNGTGRMIFDQTNNVYVGWSSGNSASIETEPADTNRWIFAYTDSKFNVNNVAVSARQLSYNVGSPRFAAYGNDGQQELQLYKLSKAATWNGTVWSNTTGPDATIDAIIDANFTTTGNLTAKSITVNQGKVFTVASGHTLTVVNAIENNSVVAGVDTFVVENDAVLIQTSNAVNTGIVTVKRNSSSLFRQDYTLWSSPVNGQNLRNFSPATLFNRFSTYDTAAGTNGDYLQELFTTNDINTKVFGEAKGYLIRMPNNWVENINSNVAQPYLGKFSGTLNNGDITIGLSLANTKFNLVGNPYASPISISAFFTANPNIEKTLYFWRKTNGANASSGYATSNELGTVSSSQTGTNGLNLFNTIKPGQGFFVKSNTATALSFNNGMRTNTGGTFFFKGNASSDNVHRFWLNLSIDNQVVGQTLIGYAPEATQGIDNGLDALYFNDSATALTSLVNANEYIIQGRALPFEASDVVVLGFKSNTAGTFTISLADFDGLFTGNQDIFLKDKATNTVHNLKNTAYIFTTPVGVFNERFEVQYESALGTSNPSLISNTILISIKNQQIKINAGALQMEKIEILDVSGRIIYIQKGVQASTAIIDQITASNQMLIVRITTKENGTSSHKIVF